MNSLVALTAARIERDRAELIDLCRRLVESPSPNPPGDTQQIASVICDYLEQHGLSYEVIYSDPRKPNVVASCTGAKPGLHLVMNGHMDTLDPGDERDWSVPVYQLTRRDGRLMGLGIGNMKGALAAFCVAFRALAECRDQWSGTITLTTVADEVVLGDAGSAFLLGSRPDLRGDALLNGEGPGFMDLAVAEKGLLWVSLETSAPSGQGMILRSNSSATARLARAIVEVDGFNSWATVPPDELADLSPDRAEEDLRCSANVGVIKGGTFISQVASQAQAEVDLRIPPGLDLNLVGQRLDEVTGRCPGVTWRTIKGWNANWTSPGSDFVQSVVSAVASVRGKAPRLAVRLPASDAHRWRALGTAAVCYGPQPTLAAGVDDFAFEQDVVDCVKVYAAASLRFLSGV